MKLTHNWLKQLLAASVVLAIYPAYATHLNVNVTDPSGKRLKQVVVFLEPQFQQAKVHSPANITIDQRDKEFIPLVTAIQVGTSVRFPNSDRIRHHVYSFSQPKTFQIPLYKDVEPRPISFDKAGVVPLGCNIHDWMKAFVFVSKTPYFSLTNKAGQAQIKNLPSGKYLAKLYHPSMKNWQTQAGKLIQVSGDHVPTLQLKLAKKKKIFSFFRPPTGGSSAYH